MNKIRLSILAITTLLLSNSLSAQTATYGTIENQGDVNFTELANYFKAHPTPLVRKPMFDEDGERNSRPKPRKVDPSLIRMIQRTEAQRNYGKLTSAYLPVSPSPADTFMSSPSDNTSIPPDTHGAVDSTYCVSAINDSVVIRLKTGAFVSGMVLDNFWSSMETHGAGAYDPRIHYDPNYGRWIFVTDCYGETDYSTIFVAVSATGNPTGTWHMYKLVVGGSSGTWLDFPCVGFNNKWVAVSGNFFTSAGSFTHDVIYTFNYASMMAGTAVTTSTLTPTGGSFCVAPALTYDASEPNLYAIEDHNGGSGQLKLWKISGPVGTPVLSAVTAVPTSTIHWQQDGNGGADFAPQLGTTDLIQTNDDRINNLQQRNGMLWCAHNIFLPATGTATRCSAMWWEIDTTGTPVQNGIVDDPTNTVFYAFPSIAVNAAGDALMGFAYLSSNLYPSAAYSMHFSTDALDSMRPPFIFRHGQKPYYLTYSGTENRWGDYSGTCIDPVNDTDFWTIQESVPNYSGGITNCKWDTWWAHVKLCSATPSSATAINTTTTTICSGDSITYVTPAVTGATGYTWTIAGTGWAGSSSTNTITVAAGTVTGTITVTPINSCGNGTSFTITTITPVISPTASFTIASHTVPAYTNDIITYTGTTVTGGTYTWNFGAGGTATPGTGIGPQTAKWTTSGLKTVTLSVTSGGCTSAIYTDTVLVTAVSGIQAVSDPQIHVSVLPNPNSGTFNILFDEDINNEVVVNVIDMEGRTVYNNNFNGVSNNKLNIVTNNLPSGTYTVNVIVDGAIANNKITIVR